MKKNNKSLSFLNLILYDLLLILTPFLLIQNYLQITLKEISQIVIDLNFINIPLFLFTFILIVAISITIYWKRIKFKHYFIVLVLFLLMFIGQNIADYYLNYSYYDLQNNWHYFAYGLFVFVAYRYFKDKINDDSKLLRIIFLKAFIISSVDEGIQVFISNRIFDISDIAKDMWGTCLGLIVLLFWVKNYKLKNFSLVINKPFDYINKPTNLLGHLLIFTFIFLFFSSVLTDSKYFLWIIIWTFSVYIGLEILLYLLKIKYLKFAFLSLLVIFISIFTYNVTQKYDEKLEQDKSIIYYKNIPLYFFDYMIFPDGMIRLVDKKTEFRGNDFTIFKKQNPEVLIISSDKSQYEIKGFEHSQFIEFPYVLFNDQKNNLFQVLILTQKDAIEQYNRLVKQNKNVLLVIHQSI